MALCSSVAFIVVHRAYVQEREAKKEKLMSPGSAAEADAGAGAASEAAANGVKNGVAKAASNAATAPKTTPDYAASLGKRMAGEDYTLSSENPAFLYPSPTFSFLFLPSFAFSSAFPYRSFCLSLSGIKSTLTPVSTAAAAVSAPAAASSASTAEAGSAANEARANVLPDYAPNAASSLFREYLRNVFSHFIMGH